MKKIIIFLGMVILLMSIVSAAPFENGITVCDRGTEVILQQASICYGAGGALTKVINSTLLLKSINSKPFQIGTQTLIYDAPLEGQPKTVHIILTSDVSRAPTTYPSGVFAANLLAGQRLMIKLAGEYYLLSYPTGQTLFDPANLQLTHIPVGTVYIAEPYAGTAQYLFHVMGGRTIVVTMTGGSMVISSLEPGEAPAAYVVEANLSADFEVPFTKNTPQNVVVMVPPPVMGGISLSQELGVFSICRQDLDADTQQVLICKDDNTLATLRDNELRVIPIPLRGNDYTFLYEYKNGQKQVSMFEVKDLSRTNNLTYDDFIKTMIAGRRVALKFQDTL